LIDLAVPALPERTGCAFVEFARRHGDYALAGAAAVITRAADGVCTGVSAVLMSVGERPMPAVQVAATLTGQQPTAEAIGQAASAAARRDIDPHSDVHATSDYRRHLAEVMLVRALTAAAERAGA
ncbi:MAG: xanthine dehydrogenase family protein subunit M, partial [Myxococcota bacterium]